MLKDEQQKTQKTQKDNHQMNQTGRNKQQITRTARMISVIRDIRC